MKETDMIKHFVVDYNEICEIMKQFGLGVDE